MKTKEEIILMIDYLNNKREFVIREGLISIALAFASQIELLKWVLEKE